MRCRRPLGTPRKAARLFQRQRLLLPPRQRLRVLLLRGGASMRRGTITLTQVTPRGPPTSSMQARGDSTQAPTTNTATLHLQQ